MLLSPGHALPHLRSAMPVATMVAAQSEEGHLMDTTEPAGVSTHVRCDTTDMLHIHQMFRSLFSAAPALVAAVPDFDTRRAAVVADHLAEAAGGLHHHQTEDSLLWDVLEERAPSCALHVGRMRNQHAAMGALLDDLEAALPSWAGDASPEHRQRVLQRVEQIRDAVLAHFGDEEQAILPTASTTLSQREWDELGRHGRASIPKDRMFIQLGWLLDSLPPEVRGTWLRHNLPVPARFLWHTVGKRQFLAHRALVHAT